MLGRLCFKLEIGSLSWIGRSLGNYPNWKQVIPEDKALDYRITLRETEALTAFLKAVPDHSPFGSSSTSHRRASW